MDAFGLKLLYPDTLGFSNDKFWFVYDILRYRGFFSWFDEFQEGTSALHTKSILRNLNSG